MPNSSWNREPSPIALSWTGALDEGITASIGRILESAAETARASLTEQR